MMIPTLDMRLAQLKGLFVGSFQRWIILDLFEGACQRHLYPQCCHWPHFGFALILWVWEKICATNLDVLHCKLVNQGVLS
jgi:hypothetical protein